MIISRIYSVQLTVETVETIENDAIVSTVVIYWPGRVEVTVWTFVLARSKRTFESLLRKLQTNFSKAFGFSYILNDKRSYRIYVQYTVCDSFTDQYRRKKI